MVDFTGQVYNEVEYAELCNAIDKVNSAYISLAESLKPGHKGAHGKAPEVLAEIEALLNLIVDKQLCLTPRATAGLIAYVAEIGIRCHHCNTTTLQTIQGWRGIFESISAGMENGKSGKQ